MLYHVLMRALYLGIAMVHPSVETLTIMRGVALLSAPFILLLFVQLLSREFSLRASTAVFVGAFLAVSYGFWRYAVEADVYIPATLLIVLTLKLLLSAGPSPFDRRLIGATLLASLSVLFYQPAVLAVFFAFPLLLLRRERLIQLAIYLILGGAGVAIVYVVAYGFSQDMPITPERFSAFLSQRSNEFMVPALSIAVFIKSIIKSVFALGHDLVSANWVFGIDLLSQLVERVFPSNVIEEEVFAARSSGWLPYLSFFWLPALAYLAFKAVRAIPAVPWAKLKERNVQMCVLWLLVSTAVIGRLNPAGIEAWLMVLIPLFCLLAVFFFEPLVEARRTLLLTTILFVFTAHNLTGGMAITWSPTGDFDYVKGQWVIEQATGDDLIIVIDDAGLAEMLRYRSQAKVDLVRAGSSPAIAHSLLNGEPPVQPILTFGRDFLGQDVYKHIQHSTEQGGRIFLFDEFFTWDTEYSAYYRPQSDYEEAVLSELRSVSEDRHQSLTGVAYRFNTPLVADAGQ